MSNFLENGTILPSGLLSVPPGDVLGAFKKSYQNCYLRVGVVTATYEITSSSNINKFAPEYDVLTFEQNEDKATTTVTYKNCIAASSFGSIADFFEAKLRNLKKKKTKGTVPDPAGQDGAIVILLCLNGMSDKAIIVGSLGHPDRKTTLTEEGPRLEGEYNGVNIKVEKDGSTSLTFKGATDNSGNILDPSQGNTEMKIETDGSYQVSHKNTTLRLDKNGTSSLNTTGDVNVTTSQGNVNVNVSKGDINVNAPQGNITVTVLKDAIVQCQGTATVEGKLVKLGKSAVEAVIKGDTFADIFDNHQHTGNLGIPTSQPLKSMKPSLSKKVVTE